MENHLRTEWADAGPPVRKRGAGSGPLYFFDTRDDDIFIEDDVGLEYPDLEAVKVEAGRALAELARDVIPGSLKRELAVEVRDESGPVLEATMTFEAVILRPA
jgi:hypothetical protein